MSTISTLPRQPFAPLDGARLQTLTSLKNRQNAFAPIGGKRKAELFDADDNCENVDPIQFSKRSKGVDGLASSKDGFKPSAFVLTKAVASPPVIASVRPTARPASCPRPRAIALPKSPAAKLNTALAASAATALSAPAGRSPTRGSKRVGIFHNRRMTAGSPFTRVDPPAFGLGVGSGAPFSLDAALKGTISNYTSRSSISSVPPTALDVGLYGAEIDSSWNFDIHEDTPEQEMTNLLQHGACVLDISSDEESELKAQRERAEGRDKENIPPSDDVSQTTTASRAAARRPVEDEMAIEKARGPLLEMNAADYYAAGCDDASVIIVPGDEEYETDAETVVELAEESPAHVPSAPLVDKSYEFAPELNLESQGIDEIMGRRDEAAPKAALLQPIDGTGESFELWESGSAKDETETMAPPSPPPATVKEELALAVAAGAAR